MQVESRASARVCASYAMRGAFGLAGRRMHGVAFGRLKSIRHSLGRRDEDQPIKGAGGAIPTSIIAIRKVGGAGVAFDVAELLQKSSTHGDVFTRSA